MTENNFNSMNGSTPLHEIDPQQVVDKNSPMPLHYQLEQFLRNGIDSGLFPENERLPTERELQDHFGLSRTPVRQALGRLVNDGLVMRKRSLGTIVLPRRFEETLESLSTFTEEVRQSGREPGAQLLSFDLRIADPIRIKNLQLEEGAKMYRIERVRYIDDQPVGLIYSYLPIAVVPRMVPNDFAEKGPFQSMYYILRERHDITLVRAVETFKAVLLDTRMARLLQHPTSSPILLRTRISYDADDRPVAYENAYYSVLYRLEWQGDEITRVDSVVTETELPSEAEELDAR